ncbi:hypothetical protein ACKWTF_016872 [Chironomus riparius]
MIPHQKRKKSDPKAEKLAFVGYDGWLKANRLANVKQRKIVVSRDVVFLKEKFIKISQNSSHEMKRSSSDLVPFPFSSGSTIDVQTFNDSELFYYAEDSQDENEVEEHEEETDQEHIEHGDIENEPLWFEASSKSME